MATPGKDKSDPNDSAADNENSAVNFIRNKVARLYAEEPDVNAEIKEAVVVTKRSKHQEYMNELTHSGLDLATIQTKWHEYYVGLPEIEKHEVWQEFYDSQSLVTGVQSKASEEMELSKNKQQVGSSKRLKPPKKETKSVREIQKTIKNKVSAGGKITAKHHLQSLLFGLGMGFIVVFIFLFGFFNEVFISPFIQPSRADASTPIILSTDSIAPTPTPEVIIPKINVQIPVNYNETSTDESTIENDLEDGVVHYPTTVFPGQYGNAAFFGHSSNNIFNPGQYKFAFVLLHTLVPGDTFYLTYNDKVYVYKVISRNIVSPNDVSVLGPISGQTATATLITCDPPGTSLNRLIVVGQQISPSPDSNSAASPAVATTATKQLPGNGPTLLDRLLSSIFGKLVAALVVLGGGYYAIKKLKIAWSK